MCAKNLTFITPEQYTNQKYSIERENIVKFIVEQFSNTSYIDQSLIDRCFERASIMSYNVIRLQIVDQALYVKAVNTSWIHGYEKAKFVVQISSYINNILAKYKVHNVDFLLWHNEKVTFETFNEMSDCPYFLFSKSSSIYDAKKFLFPDFYMTTPEWKILTEIIGREKHNYIWENKVEKIFWRGMPTGSLSQLTEFRWLPYYGMDVFDKLPRLSLVMFSKLYPDLIDARFTGKPLMHNHNNSRDLEVVFDKLNFIDKHATEIQHFKCKYLVSLDGNNCAWKRVPWIMFSNSVLLKQETDRIEWFYPALEAYKNYIPINENITDIFTQLEWMKKHDLEARKISENAQIFIQNDLMEENIENHIAITLNEYSKLHQGLLLVATLPKFDSSDDTCTLPHAY
jgi:hypothetical protein